MEIHRVLYESQDQEKRKSFGSLKMTAGHDLEALAKVLFFFTGGSPQLQGLIQNIRKVGEYGPWVESRYNSKRFAGIDLNDVKISFDQVEQEFRSKGIDVFEKFKGDL